MLAGRGPDMVYWYSEGVAAGVALVCDFDIDAWDLVIGGEHLTCTWAGSENCRASR